MAVKSVRAPSSANLALQDGERVPVYQLMECFERNIDALNQVAEPYQPGSNPDIKIGFDCILEQYAWYGSPEEFHSDIIEEEAREEAVNASYQAALVDLVELYAGKLEGTQHVSGLSAELTISLIEAKRIKMAEMLLGKRGWRHPHVDYLHSADKAPGFIKYEHGGYPFLKLAHYYVEREQPDDAVCCWWNAMLRLSDEDLVAHRTEIRDALLEMHFSRLVAK